MNPADHYPWQVLLENAMGEYRWWFAGCQFGTALFNAHRFENLVCQGSYLHVNSSLSYANRLLIHRDETISFDNAVWPMDSHRTSQ